jgi:hypothetical protein
VTSALLSRKDSIMPSDEEQIRALKRQGGRWVLARDANLLA